MYQSPKQTAEAAPYRVHDRSQPTDTLVEDVRAGLGTSPKRLPAKYFYDETGSRLFEAICATPEYYPTRTEDALLRMHAAEIMDLAGPAILVEFGSGSAEKSEHLLAAQDGELVYVPVDVCEPVIEIAAHRLLGRFPALRVEAIVGEYERPGDLPLPDSGARLFALIGSTIGNLAEVEAVDFLVSLRRRMGPADRFLLGVDRVKPTAVLNAAYNDAAGLTAAFNLNVLDVLNRELAGDFRKQEFEHLAFFDEHKEQVEMHLRALRKHRVHLPGAELVVDFDAGETLRTEISRKFTRASLTRLLAAAGMRALRHFTPENEYFSLVLAAAESGHNG
jgi:L-histidine N-alpha-methyltransferase